MRAAMPSYSFAHFIVSKYSLNFCLPIPFATFSLYGGSFYNMAREFFFSNAGVPNMVRSVILILAGINNLLVTFLISFSSKSLLESAHYSVEASPLR